jgi:hypothetical protein
VILTSSTRAEEEEDLGANMSGPTSGEAPPGPSASPKGSIQRKSNEKEHSMEKVLTESSSKPHDSSK